MSELIKRLSENSENSLFTSELFTLVLSRKDALKIMETFNDDISKILEADFKTLEKISSKKTAAKIISIKALMRKYLKTKAIDSDIMSSPEAVADYLSFNLGHKEREYFHVLLLNSMNKIIHEETLFAGSATQAQIYPREILKLALQHNATAIIIAHNHPSGNSEPSDDDIYLTSKLENLFNEVDIKLHDHIVVTKNKKYSIKGNRYI